MKKTEAIYQYFIVLLHFRTFHFCTNPFFLPFSFVSHIITLLLIRNFSVLPISFFLFFTCFSYIFVYLSFLLYIFLSLWIFIYLFISVLLYAFISPFTPVVCMFLFIDFLSLVGNFLFFFQTNQPTVHFSQPNSTFHNRFFFFHLKLNAFIQPSKV